MVILLIILLIIFYDDIRAIIEKVFGFAITLACIGIGIGLLLTVAQIAIPALLVIGGIYFVYKKIIAA